jgi:multidrug efflux pump subunit AcrA (membrane-fusion protein)
MSASTTKTTPITHDAWWARVEVSLEKTLAEAREARNPADFWTRVLPDWVQTLAADEAVLWWGRSPDGTDWQCVATHASDGARLSGHETSEPASSIRAADRPLVLAAPRNELSSSDRSSCKTRWLCPLLAAGKRCGVLELRFVQAVPSFITQHADAFLEAFADCTRELVRQLELGSLRQRVQQQQALEQVILQLNRSAELADFCQELVEEGRRLIPCDRVSVALPYGSTWRIRAVSGVEQVERRAGTIEALENLIRAVAKTGEAWNLAEPIELPPLVAEPWSRYSEISAVRELEIVPLGGSSWGLDTLASEPTRSRDAGRLGPAGQVVAWLVAERFTGRSEGDAEPIAVRLLARHAEPVLRRLTALESVPGWRIWRRLATGGRAGLWAAGWGKVAGVIVGLGGLVALALIPVEFTIRARGELVPSQRHALFAATDGRVTEVRVEHGSDVRRGDLLIELTNRDLEYESARLDGEIETTRARLDALAPRLNLRPVTPTELAQRDAEVAEVERQKTLLAGLQRQQALLTERRAELRILAPLAGRVMTWSPRQTLLGRPVRRGQLLLTLADLHGDWELDLTIRDADVGHVVQAQDAWRNGLLEQRVPDPATRSEPPLGQTVPDRASSPEKRPHDPRPGLPVRFILATDPTQVRHAWLEQVALATEIAADSTPVLRLVARPDPPAAATDPSSPASSTHQANVDHQPHDLGDSTTTAEAATQKNAASASIRVLHSNETTHAEPSVATSEQTTRPLEAVGSRNANRSHETDNTWRPGAEVIAEIECGQRPLGYVWARRLIEAIQIRLW